MSAVTFDASLNTEKLDTAFNQSSQTVSNWAKNVEKQGGIVDQALNKSTKTFKEAIAEQKNLIKSIESDIKTLQKAYDDSTAGKAKQSSYNELKAAKKSLAEEQATLLGLQKDQIAANKAEAGSADGIISRLKAWALGLLSVGAAMKAGKAIIDSNSETTIRFNKIVAAAESGVKYFFKAIASGDWKNFSQGMDNAIRGAQEYVEAMANLRNEENAQKIKSSEDDVKIAELRDKTYDKDKKNTGERFAALRQIIDLEKEKYTQEAALAKSAYDINLKKAATDSGLSTQQIENFLKEYKSLEDLIAVGRKYNELTSLMRKPGMNAAYVADLMKERDALKGNAAEAGAYVTAIGKVTPEVRKQLSDAAASANEAAAAFGQKNRRDKMQAAQAWNELWDAWMAEIDDMNKVWEERNNISKKIGEQEKLLNDAIAEGSDAEIRAIGNRIVALKEELRVREKLAKSIVDALQFQGFVPTKVQTGGIKIPTLGVHGTTPTPEVKTPEQLKKESTTLAPLSHAYKDATDNQTKLNKLFKEGTKNELELVQAAGQLVMQLGQQVGMGENELNVLKSSVDVITGLVSGDPAAIIGSVEETISTIISLIPTAAEKLAGQVESINALIKEQQHLIAESDRTGGGVDARKKVIENLQQLKALQEQASKKVNIKWYDVIFGPIGLAAGIKDRKKKIEELKQAIVDTGYSIEEAQQALDDFMNGDITENILADAIAQGFQEGKTSVDDFAEYMNKVLLDGIMNVFKEQVLKPIIHSTLDPVITDAFADGVLTPEEVAKINAAAQKVINQAKPAFDAIDKLNLGDNTLGQASTITGTIMRNITEDTATEWVGLARKQSDDIRMSRDYLREGIGHLTRLAAIEKNTGDTVLELQKLNVKTDQVISNTKPAYSGLGG